RGCFASSVQRIAGPPLGPFSSVNVARAVVGSTTSGSSAVFRQAVTRVRVVLLAAHVRNSIFVVVIGLLSRPAAPHPPAHDVAGRAGRVARGAPRGRRQALGRATSAPRRGPRLAGRSGCPDRATR